MVDAGIWKDGLGLSFGGCNPLGWECKKSPSGGLCWKGFLLGMAVCVLLVEDLFYVADFLLGFALGLFDLTFGLQSFISNGFTGGLLGFAFEFLAGAFCFVLIA